MPRGDRTGPTGAGPMSGRALGYCAGYDAPGFTAGPGRGMGRGMGWRNARGFGGGFGPGYGRGMGRGFGPAYGRGFYPDQPYEDLAPTREEELQALKHQAERLQRTLDEVNQRIKDLEE